MKIWRDLLYVPGDDLHKINKAVSLGVDAICLDLEDGVAINRKIIARQTISKAIKSYNFGNASLLVRTNPIDSPFVNDDLEAIVHFQLDGIVVPKINYPEQIKWISQQLAIFEIKNGMQVGKIHLHLIIETAKSIILLDQIVKADKRIKTLIFGAEDLAADINALRTNDSTEIHFARSMIVLHASANGMQSIDMVRFDFEDQAGLIEECKVGRQMGYTGKQIIHPNQVKIVQEAFTPTLDEVHIAMSLLTEYQNLKGRGIAVFSKNGKLIDAPIILAAENVVARARSAGIDHKQNP
jgi:citrate lyase beta subunit